MGDRLALTEFWEKRSHEPTVETMMLNVLAQTVDIQDKQDVLDALPDYTNMRIIELGAGIGRITPILASKAKHVLAVDIVESFVETNRKNNEHMGNITFETCEASKMNVSSNSIDILFTNWLLMYLTDAEVIDLLKSALNWLDVDGFFHIRESCSEPSKRNSVSSLPPGQTVATETNPTHYRHVFQYLTLLDSIGIYDEIRKVGYKFEILWSKSVNTYVEAYGNWRQNQILVRKITADEPVVPKINGVIKDFRIGNRAFVEDATLLSKLFKNESFAERCNFDANEQILKLCSLTTRFIVEAMKASMENPSWILNVSSNDQLTVCPFEIAKNLDARVADLEASIYAYNWKLAKAVSRQDKRVRLYWTDLRFRTGQKLNWAFLQRRFDAIVLTQPNGFDGQSAAMISEAKKSLLPDGRIFMICAAENGQSITEVLKTSGCEIARVSDISAEFRQQFMHGIEVPSTQMALQSIACYGSMLSGDKAWFLIEAE